MPETLHRILPITFRLITPDGEVVRTTTSQVFCLWSKRQQRFMIPVLLHEGDSHVSIVSENGHCRVDVMRGD